MAERRRESGGAERLLAWAAGAIAVVAALAIGGVHPTTQLALSAAALALTGAFLWVRRRDGFRGVPFLLPLAALVAFPMLQLLPLPGALVRALSPAAFEVVDEATGAAWMPLTLDVPATILEVAKALATLGLFIVVAKTTRRSTRAPRALVPIAVAGGLVAVIFLVQRGTHAQSVLGLYQASDPLGSSVVGTFINGNHGASFLSLATLLSTGLALGAVGWRRALFAVCAALAAVATIGSTSRSGAFGLGAGAIMLFSIALRRRVGTARALAATIVVTIVAATATLWVAESLRSRLTPASVEELVDNPKVRGWRDGLRVARRFPWSGAGRGAFEAVVAADRSQDEGVRLVYAENGLVQPLADFGIMGGFSLFALFAASAARVGRRILSVDAATLGAAAAVVAVGVHELADFALETLGVALPTAVALGVVVARSSAHSAESGARRVADRARADDRRRPWRIAAAVAASWPLVLAGAAWASSRTLEADTRAVERAERAGDAARVAALVDEARRRHPAADYFELVAAREALRTRQPARALKHLNRALRLHPAGWQGHRLASRALVALGQRKQAALELRLQAESGVPPSHDEAMKVVGDAVVDSVPQKPPELMALARWLARAGKPRLADEAARRALDVALLFDADEQALALERLAIASIGADRELIRVAARAALQASATARVAAAAAEALHAANLPLEADAALKRGLERAPTDPPLLLVAARIAFERNDSAKAVTYLRTLNQQAERASLADRRAAEELLAQIYERTGDVEAAVIARGRARLLEQQLKGYPH